MKYRVIGWTSDTDETYPFHKHNTACVERAIAEEIREHGYCFGGDAHEDYCPVLNDGTKVSFSWRGWGGVMARARGETDPMSYMHYYMNALIPEELIRYPDSTVRDEEIVPKQSLRETFVMHLADQPFFAMQRGEKKEEIRLFDDKRKGVDVGDIIVFVRLGHEDERLEFEVKDISLYTSFHSLYRFECENAPDRSARLLNMGFGEDADAETFVAQMREYYPEEEEEKYGVIVFKLGSPAHSAVTYVLLSSDAILVEDDKLREIFGDELHFTRRGYIFGRNEEYDVDLNKMIHKTIMPLIGKEAQIKELLEENELRMYVQVVLRLESKSDEPYPILPPDSALVSFLFSSGTQLDIDYYIY